jgi:uncharacterized RDD family membrane protein YckC
MDRSEYRADYLGFVMVMVVIGWLWVLATLFVCLRSEERRRIGDYLANTMVRFRQPGSASDETSRD